MKPICWEDEHRLPREAKAVLSALSFTTPRTEALAALEEREWQRALSFCDRTQLTLHLGDRCRGVLPLWVQERIDGNLDDNAQRLNRLMQDAREISDALRQSPAEFVVLKGFTQWPEYVSDLRLRVQYDLDLFCPKGSILRAKDALGELGYETVAGLESFPIDHLPAMVRRTGWRWRGNYFDPEIPAAVELHFRFWDEETERFPAPGVETFWSRRTEQAFDGGAAPVLHPLDALAYSCLHLVRHLLRGSLRLCHAYELSYFLHTHAEDEAFWNEWTEAHEPGLRRIEAIALRLVGAWFGGRIPTAVEEEIRSLPSDVNLWFERYAASPVTGLFRPNKDELWLHLSLLEGFRDGQKVLRRRLIPVRMPGGADPSGVPEDQITSRMRWAARATYSVHLVSRAVHHGRTLLPSLGNGLLWWIRTRGPCEGFWRFLLTASLFHFGVFLFVLLYNLYLLDLGFRENFLGIIAGTATAGSLAGALPAAWIARKAGLRRTVLLCFSGAALVSCLRSVLGGETWLVGTAFAGGVLSALWFVLIPPAVSSMTDDRKRPAAFSLFFSAGIGVGIVAGLVGGRLPQWIGHWTGLPGPADWKRAALLLGCGFMALAAWPGARLRLPRAARIEQRLYPWNPFLARFLPALALWSAAVGFFNPFFTAYFARRLQAGEASIGLVFSGSQLIQLAAVLLAPLVLKKFGPVGGIVMMQMAAALALAWLSAGPPILAAGALYAAYMGFQSMCEPGLYSLLMQQVKPEQRGGASALNFLVIFSTQALAATASGAVISRFGYSVMLGIAATAAAAAAASFGALLGRFQRFREALKLPLRSAADLP